jgi:inorganic phosphate transporter, PiT family
VVGSIFMSWLITLPAGAFLSIVFFTILKAIFV